MSAAQIDLFDAVQIAEPDPDVDWIGEARIKQTAEWMAEEAACLGRTRLRQGLDSYDELTPTQRFAARLQALELCSIRWGSKRVVP